MNIVVLTDFAFVDGGASKVALSSARALAASGHRVVLFTAVGPIAQEIQGVGGLEVHCLYQHEMIENPNPLRAAIQGLWNHKAAEALKHVLLPLSPNDTIIHLHTWTKALSSSVVHAGVELGFQVVLTLHDYFSACPNGGFFLYPEKEICRLRPMSAACVSTQCDGRNYGYKLWRVGRQFIQERVGGIPNKVNRFISISDQSEQVLRPYLPIGARIHRVANPIDRKQGPPSDPASHDRFCFVGRLAPEKGPALLASCVTQSDLKVVFIGDGPERESLTRIAPKAEFTGWLASEGVKKVMQSSRALVFTSMWYETQGLAVAEAAAVGLPAVVPSESAAREWVEDGITGLVFEHGNGMDLCKRLRWLQSNPDRSRALGLKAYERYWRSPSTMERHCEALEQVYCEMLHDAGSTNT